MKYGIILIFSFYVSLAYGQETKNDTTKSINAQIKDLLTNVTRDSTDKRCQQLLSDFYNCFESDEGQTSPAMIPIMMNLFKYKDDLKLPNRQIALLLYKYINSVSEPQKALIWISALKEENYKVYGQSNPLILLFEGESLINFGEMADAHLHFLKFQKQYPESITALCYIYETESDKYLAKTWLSILKKQYPTIG